MHLRLLPPDPELGWTPYGYLVYLGFFLIKPVFFPQWPWEWPVTALGVVVFLVLYFRAYWLAGWQLLLPIGGIVVLGALFAPINYGAGGFIIYAGAFAGRLGPERHAWRVVLALTAVPLVLAWVLGLSPFFWVPAIVFTPLIGGLNIHHDAMRRAGAKLRLSQEEVSRLAKIAERERIARDLHDLLGHNLALITLKSELAARLAERDPERAAAEMREVERVSRQTTREVRAAVAGYRSRSLAEEVDQVRAVLDTAGVAFDDALEPVELEPLVEGVLSLALREAVTNVVRHAGARHCRVTLDGGDGEVRLEIADDGHGTRAPEGNGLRGMRERVTALGGRLERVVEEGTRLVIHLPRRVPGAAEGGV